VAPDLVEERLPPTGRGRVPDRFRGPRRGPAQPVRDAGPPDHKQIRAL